MFIQNHLSRGCQFGNEIVCLRDSLRLEINGGAIKTGELQYLVTIMIMTLARRCELHKWSGGGGCEHVRHAGKLSGGIALPPSASFRQCYFSFNRVAPLRKYLDFLAEERSASITEQRQTAAGSHCGGVSR